MTRLVRGSYIWHATRCIQHRVVRIVPSFYVIPLSPPFVDVFCASVDE